MIESAAPAVMETAKPIDDMRSSAAYRKAMVKALTKRAMEAVVAVVDMMNEVLAGRNSV